MTPEPELAEATELAAAWGWGPDPELEAVRGGLINATYAVRVAGRPVAVLQRLHPVFGGAVNLDLECAHVGTSLTTVCAGLSSRRPL